MTEMAEQSKKSLKKADGKQFAIEAHFEPIPEKQIPETLDILASIICNYIDKEYKSE